jgi:membrane-bound serine protease (ClpP class)
MKAKKRNLLARSSFGLLALCIFGLVLVSCLSSSVSVVHAQNSSGPLIIANFDVGVDPGSSAFMTRVVNTAKSQGASAILIEMNTPGGLLSGMLSIVTSITTANQSGIPTYTFIVPNGLGASAGSYIAMATNKILMGPGSELGPSTPIVVGGTDLEQNHTQSAMLQLMTSLAQKWGRNQTAAYNMVQSDQAYSANDAVTNQIADGLASSLNSAIDQFGLSGKQQIVLSESLYEQFISALSNPTLDGILILLGIIAIVLDVFHPTIILTIVGVFAIIAGLIGAEVVDASLLGYLIIGIAAVLIIFELKIGHGFAIIAGAFLGAFGVYYLYQGLGYSPSPITFTTELGLSLIVVVGVLVGLYLRWVIGPLRRRAKLTGPESIVGKIGVVITDLKPDGEVRIEGVIWRAKSTSGEILRDQKVKVKAIKGLVLEVEKT